MWFWIFAALLTGNALLIVTSPNPPMLQDYPDWVYQGVLFAKLLTRHPVSDYMLKPYPVPNSLTTVGVGVLTLLVGWQVAAKLWLVLVLAALGAACVRLIGRLGGENGAVLPVFACSVIAGLDFWDGSINFQLSLAFLLVLLGHLLRPNAGGTRTGVLLLLCFFTHMLPCGAGLLALTALALRERNWKRLLPALPVLVLAGWYGLARDATESRQSPVHLLPAVLAVAGTVWWTARRPATGPRVVGEGAALALALPFRLRYFLLYCGTKVLILFGWIGPVHVLASGSGTDRVLWPATVFTGLAMLGACSAGVGLWTLGTAWSGLVQRRDPRCFIAATAIAFVVAFLLSPSDALGVTAIDSRFLHLGIAVGLGLLSLTSSRLVRALATLAVVVAVVNLGQFAAVQFRPTTISEPAEQHVLLGASPVSPAVRVGYYRSLESGTYDRWIFPTALFRWRAR